MPKYASLGTIYLFSLAKAVEVDVEALKIRSSNKAILLPLAICVCLLLFKAITLPLSTGVKSFKLAH